jgi:hypothetical protein
VFGRRRKIPQRVEIDDTGVRRFLANGTVEAVDWNELTEVRVITTADGPAAEDVFIALIAEGSGRGCVVPQGLADDRFVRRLQPLPGSDNAALIHAMGSTEKATFVCWRKPARDPGTSTDRGVTEGCLP